MAHPIGPATIAAEYASIPPCRPVPARSATRRLALAAAPTFATMAVVAGVVQTGTPGPICTTSHAGPWLVGMVPMYLLMSLFHAAPWWRVVARHRRRRTRRDDMADAQ